MVSLTCGAALLATPLILSLSWWLQDRNVAVGCEMVAFEEPAEGLKWETSRALVLRTWFPCDPQADCSFFYLPMAQGSTEDWLLTGPVEGVAITHSDVERMLPASRSLDLSATIEGLQMKLAVSSGVWSERRIRFSLYDPRTGWRPRGEFALSDCASER